MKTPFTRLQATQGFTLVELLIVVAIVGVLATVGVPTYRKMVQKAKKSEAKVGLGGLYTVEQAFFSEYGTFGNNIDKIGFELDGVVATRTYAIGFPTATCAAPGALAPAIANPAGVALNTAFPAYYGAGPVYFHPAGKMPSACEAATVPVDGSTFTASANGLIAPNAPAANYDGWTMDNTRTLKNTKDGTY